MNYEIHEQHCPDSMGGEIVYYKLLIECLDKDQLDSIMEQVRVVYSSELVKDLASSTSREIYVESQEKVTK